MLSYKAPALYEPKITGASGLATPLSDTRLGATNAVDTCTKRWHDGHDSASA
jgi:hypothetical protein